MIPTTESVTTLAKRWAAGDRRAGSELVEKHDGWIRTYARRIAKAGEDVDDMAQMMRLEFLESSSRASTASCDQETRAYLRLWMKGAISANRRSVDAAERHDAYFAERYCAGDWLACFAPESGPDRSTEVVSDFEWSDPHRAIDATQEAVACVRGLINGPWLTDEDRTILFGVYVEESTIVDVAARLGRDKKTTRRLLDAAMSKIAIACGIDPPQALRSTASRRPEDETDERVAAFVRDCGPVGATEIRCSLRLTKGVFSKSIQRLLTGGIVEPSGPWNRPTYSAAS